MSNQSPSANGRDQQGTEVTNREPPPPIHDESGFTGGGGERADDPPASTDIDETEDPSKD